jgi:hypothetical protein
LLPIRNEKLTRRHRNPSTHHQDKEPPMCSHVPQCPDSDGEARDLAMVISSHPEQGWRLLCNGVVLFDDDGELLPDGRAVPDHHIWQAMGSLAAS